jgi:hypothetical protein
MALYRKKPIVIDAVRWEAGMRLADLPNWALPKDIYVHVNRDGALTITTMEGQMRADIGDWIICGVKGELYSCKPDIFAATYELVQE